MLPTQEKRTKLAGFLIVLGVIFFAANLRAALTSVGPVIEEIRLALSLSNTAAGLVTTIPLLAFALLSSFVPRISERYGMQLVLFISLLILALGLGIRSYGAIGSLFIGAALIGIAITFGNVLMPAFIKVKFPDKIGSMMGVYTLGMNLTAALAAGFSISIGKWTQLGWKASIGIWAILAVVGAIVWLPQVKASKADRKTAPVEEETPIKVNLFTSKVAWAVTIFMGLQSLLFYCFSTWLPKAVQDWGVSIEASGWVLSYIQFAQLPTSFLAAIFAVKMRNQVFLSATTAVLFIIGILGLLVFKTQFLLLWCILLGIASGLAFALSMLFFVLRTQSVLQAAKLSGMAQSIGYLIAATGPPIFGALFDFSASWTLSFIFLLVLCVILFVAGIIAGKDTWVS